MSWSAHAAQLSGTPITISGNPWHLVQVDSERFHQLFFTAPQRSQVCRIAFEKLQP